MVVNFSCTDGGSNVASSTGPVTLSGEGENQSVTGTCTDLAGNSASASFTGIKIDKTAPEAFLQFDPATRDAVLFGRDALSGVPPVSVPTQSAPASWTASDDLFGVNVVLPGEGASQTVQRTYGVADAAGNTLALVVKVRKSNRQIKTRIISLQYNNQLASTPPRNTTWFAWTVNASNSIQVLTQTIARLQSTGGPESVTAVFDSRLNRTDIIRLLPLPQFIIQTGLALLRMATNTGGLVIEF